MSHALLLCGPRGTERRETAIFIAQSLVCQHSEEGLACEECESCQRIAQGQYADLIVLDGADRSIKKDEILSLQEQFSKTALEGNGKKIYILDHAENATPEALNSLLKFLEEPAGQRHAGDPDCGKSGPASADRRFSLSAAAVSAADSETGAGDGETGRTG